jgi:hypothetical protein
MELEPGPEQPPATVTDADRESVRASRAARPERNLATTRRSAPAPSDGYM